MLEEFLSHDYPFTDVVRLVRRIRHRYLNHFQVAYGWLQLDEPLRAFEYMTEVRRRLAAEGRMMRSVPDEFALGMLAISVELEPNGIIVDFDFEETEEREHDRLPAVFSSPEFTVLLGEGTQQLCAGFPGADRPDPPHASIGLHRKSNANEAACLYRLTITVSQGLVVSTAEARATEKRLAGTLARLEQLAGTRPLLTLCDGAWTLELDLSTREHRDAEE